MEKPSKLDTEEPCRDKDPKKDQVTYHEQRGATKNDWPKVEFLRQSLQHVGREPFLLANHGECVLRDSHLFWRFVVSLGEAHRIVEHQSQAVHGKPCGGVGGASPNSRDTEVVRHGRLPGAVLGGVEDRLQIFVETLPLQRSQG